MARLPLRFFNRTRFPQKYTPFKHPSGFRYFLHAPERAAHFSDKNH
jgi:hypothetical protein